MNGLPYYKAYPRDFIEGTIGMPFEIKCAYRVVLDLIYMQGGALPDDDRYISGLLGCSVRKWKSIRLHLIDAGKIYANGEFLSNYRADSELETLAKLQERQRENRLGANKNKGLQKPRSGQPESEPEPESDGGDKRAREFRELILEAIGVDPVSGLTGRGGQMIGTVADMQEARRWSDDLGLSESDCLAVIAECMARKRDGPPSTFRYFTPAMQRLSGSKAEPKLTPIEGGKNASPAGTRSRPSADDICRAADAIAARL